MRFKIVICAMEKLKLRYEIVIGGGGGKRNKETSLEAFQ